AMLGNLVDYFADFEQLWLLALSGSVILVLDVWVILEGIWVLLNPGAAPPEMDTRSASH
ncbi:MAG: hypothetical protein JRG94_18275, partial [Deltaproteobacteria bacterium]|nr:hypothetical protein [Deltaproteobacteria bacterium]